MIRRLAAAVGWMLTGAALAVVYSAVLIAGGRR